MYTVNKGDLCNAKWGNRPSNYLSILYNLHRKYPDNEDFLVELFNSSSKLNRLANGVDIDRLTDLIYPYAKETCCDVSLDVNTTITKAFKTSKLDRYLEVIVNDILRYESVVVDVRDLATLQDIKMYVTCFDNKYDTWLNGTFEIAIETYNHDKIGVAHDVYEAIDYM